MEFLNVDDLNPIDIVPGYHGRFIHTEHNTLAFWEVDAGAALPHHQHMHEQVTHVLAGKFEMIIDGEVHLCTAGDVAIIPGGVFHSGRALTACRLLDVFYPVRQEYR